MLAAHTVARRTPIISTQGLTRNRRKMYIPTEGLKPAKRTISCVRLRRSGIMKLVAASHMRIRRRFRYDAARESVYLIDNGLVTAIQKNTQSSFSV